MPKPDQPQPDERERALAALNLRRDGLPYREIAARLDYADESGARKAVSRLLDRTEAEGVAELRRLESERLDALMGGHWSAAIAGDTDAARIVLGVIDRRTKLFGLNAPIGVSVGVEPVSEREFAEAAVELIASLRPDMAAALAGTLPGIHGAERTERPEGNETCEPVSPASGAHSAETDAEPWADVDDYPVRVVPMVEPEPIEPEPEAVAEPEPTPRRVYAPPVAPAGFGMSLGGARRPTTIVHNAP
ncbi:hypothetical protein R4144_12755 [Gordonia amicalis]|uniref:hypothetical protein n=1 Tax=Gordonia amicalis TaxID=89053 RepID=UPI002955B83F|nr:hypothetical protein [Gordonia amicalis]MDV7174229.1 hypothetical protein [Gordonia amicalis]